MNNKGFTLIELIATIALLAVISVISVVSISGVINKSKVNNCESLVSSIKSAVNEYVSDNRYNFTSNNNFTITGDKLINQKYLVGPIINPFDNEEIASNSVRIKVVLNNNYTLKDAIIEAPAILANCDAGI